MAMRRAVDLEPHWDRFQKRAFAALPYGLLAVSLTITFAVSGVNGATELTLLWSLGALTWVLLGYTLRAESCATRPRLRCCTSSACSPSTRSSSSGRPLVRLRSAFSGYLHAFDTLPGLWVFAGTGANAVLHGDRRRWAGRRAGPACRPFDLPGAGAGDHVGLAGVFS